MKSGLQVALFLSILVAAFALVSAEGSAAPCKLSTSTGQLTMVERNINYLEKSLTGPGREITLSDLRSKVSSLRSRGKEFSTKAAPIEKECRTLGKLLSAKIKEAEKERDVRLNKLKAERKAEKEKLNRASNALDESRRHHNALGCGMGGKLSKEKLAYCLPLNEQFNSTWINPYNNITLKNYRRRKKKLLL